MRQGYRTYLFTLLLCGGLANSEPTPGKLRMVTVPWSTVSLEDRTLGQTPLVDVRLPAGRHQLKVVWSDGAPPTMVEVDIKPAETTTVKLKR